LVQFGARDVLVDAVFDMLALQVKEEAVVRVLG
jgi:hypothetical protein